MEEDRGAHSSGLRAGGDMRVDRAARSSAKVTLVHDWLTGMRGGERVLEILCRLYPRATIYTLLHNRAAVAESINSHPIFQSWIGRLPKVRSYYRMLLPIMPAAIETMRLPDSDIVISSSHCVAKGVKAPQGTPHLCYCFTPMRYAWTFYGEYFGAGLVKAALAKPLLVALRSWDRRSSSRVDRFVAISSHVQRRIKLFYGRDADVVYPPVDTGKWTPSPERTGNFDLIVSALVPYKRLDLAVRAYAKSGFPLKVVGSGSGLRTLQRMAGPNVELLGYRTDEEILALYRNARLLVFPGEEDFGIVPLEAQACGCPVVAYRKGGALETVVENVTGVFFDEQSEESLLAATAMAASKKWVPEELRANAERFSVPSFERQVSAIVSETIAAGGKSAPFDGNRENTT